ncbi:hypothetical protein GGI12_001117 [Dipsacomyces acuminosporus]|nr:hypothetical protein GGI12_001117 [Dipsacomyces acuminosporus]
MLYVIALHSIRIMLLYSHVYFASPNILNGSFRKVTLEKGRSQLRVSHCRLDELFGSIYISNDPSSSEANGILWYWYDSLAKQLKSKLGRMLTEQSEMYVYLNIGLADIPSEDLKRVNLALNGGSDGGNSNNPTMANPTENNAGQSKHQINGIEIDNDLYDKLCRYQYILNGKVDEVLERFEATDIFWGPKLWLLRILRIAYKDVKSCENAIGIHDEELKLPEKIRNKARILCFSPFQLMSERPNNKYKLWKHLDQLSGWFGNWDPLGELDTKQGAEQKRPKAHNNDWYSPSMWCICSDNCSGICTLVVNEFKLGISVSQYMKCPYSFYLDDEEAEKRHANKYIRLACASRKEGFRSLGRKIGELEECATGASFDSGIPAEKRIYSIADVIYDSDAATPVVIGESIYRWRENNCNSPDARASDDTLQGISRKLANGYKLVIPPPEIPYKNEADWQSMAAGYAVHISEKKRKELKSKAKKSMIRLPKPERRARTER